MERNHKKFADFIGEIVVFNGVIADFNSIQEFVEDDDDLRLASEEEIDNYFLTQGDHDFDEDLDDGMDDFDWVSEN